MTASGGFDGSVKKLMKPKCTTNAGQRIGVKVGANRRGDQAYFRLYCKVPGAKATGTRSTGRGDGSRYCTSGSLKVRALAGGLTLRVVWSAPATSDFKGLPEVEVLQGVKVDGRPRCRHPVRVIS